MSRLFGPIFQAAYVVTDFDAAVAHWTGTIGVGPFFLFPTPLPFEWLERRGERTTEFDILSHCGLAYSGDTLIELIAPGSAPSPYREFLDAGRRGLHHVGTIATDYGAQMAVARAAGSRWRWRACCRYHASPTSIPTPLFRARWSRSSK